MTCYYYSKLRTMMGKMPDPLTKRKKEEVREKVISLISRYPEGIYNRELPAIYENLYGEDLTKLAAAMGYSSAFHLCERYKDVIRCFLDKRNRLCVKIIDEVTDEVKEGNEIKNDVRNKRIPDYFQPPDGFPAQGDQPPPRAPLINRPIDLVPINIGNPNRIRQRPNNVLSSGNPNRIPPMSVPIENSRQILPRWSRTVEDKIERVNAGNSINQMLNNEEINKAFEAFELYDSDGDN